MFQRHFQHQLEGPPGGVVQGHQFLQLPIAHLAVEAIRTEQQPVAPPQGDLAQFRLEGLGAAERLGDHVALGMRLGLFPGQIARGDHLVDQGLVRGELDEFRLAIEIGPAVAHLDEVRVPVPDDGRRQGGAHTARRAVIVGVAQH